MPLIEFDILPKADIDRFDVIHTVELALTPHGRRTFSFVDSLNTQ